MTNWIKTKDRVPNHGRDVAVIIIIEDIDPEAASGRTQKRFIAIGRFEHSRGWAIKNGFLKWRSHYEAQGSSEIKSWDCVTHWHDMDTETTTILAKRGWDAEDFKDS